MSPDTLIDYCRRLGAGELSAPVTAGLTQAVEEMSVRFALPFPPALGATWSAAGPRSRTRRGQWHELVQHLTDLAYLSLDGYQAWHATRATGGAPTSAQIAEVVAAVRAFVREERPRASLAGFPDEPAAAAEWVEDHLTPIVHYLGRYTSWDGELAARAAFRIGERSVFGRSLAYRLRMLYRDRFASVDLDRSPFLTDELSGYLAALSNLLVGERQVRWTDGSRLPAGLQRYLLDATALFTIFRRRFPRLPEFGGTFFIVYSVPLPEHGSVLPLEEQVGIGRHRGAERIPGVQADTDVNRFGRRLLQLMLWRAGFYDGVLDSAFGLRTHRALLLLLQQEGRHRRGGPPSGVLVGTGAPGGYAVHLRRVARLLTNYAPPDRDTAREEEDALWRRIDTEGLSGRVDTAFLRGQRAAAPAYGRAGATVFRRVYYGLRSIIRGAWRGVGRVLDWLRGTAQMLLGAVFDFIKATAKRLQEGGSLFLTGFRYFGHFVLGRPFLTYDARGGVVAVTRYAIDLDTVNLADRGAAGADLTRHTATLRQATEAAGFFLEVAARLIRTVADLGGGGSWVWLGVRLARGVRRLLRD